jgi:hypothetical protein
VDACHPLSAHPLPHCSTTYEPAQKFPNLIFLKELSFRTSDTKHAARVVQVRGWPTVLNGLPRDGTHGPGWLSSWPV